MTSLVENNYAIDAGTKSILLSLNSHSIYFTTTYHMGGPWVDENRSIKFVCRVVFIKSTSQSPHIQIAIKRGKSRHLYYAVVVIIYYSYQLIKRAYSRFSILVLSDTSQIIFCFFIRHIQTSLTNNIKNIYTNS